ncbi:hypothetical protein [Isoptericola sp. QY 916]|uniref:hypothetical protein n=1 Tax=Isoptericola sp. QY 916 TaxID=2782570 RepID=UPI003D300B2C|nr:hypothetical protein [Isoptericola sp. QY 916]
MGRTGWWSAKRAWQVVAAGLVVAAACYLLTAPVYQAESVCSGGGAVSPSGETVSEWDTCEPATSLLAAEAWSYVAGIVPPVLLAALPLAARGRAWTVLSVISAVCLVAYVLLGGFSVGLLFAPGALCAVVGATVRRPRPGTSPRAEQEAP